MSINRELAARMAEDAGLQAEARHLFARSCEYRYSYNFTWLGRPIIQYPQDMIAIQEIVWRTRPDIIVETGIAHGGSLVYHASLLELLGGDGIAVGIDIDIRAHNRAAIEEHPMFRRIRLIEGSSIDEGVFSQAVALIRSLAQQQPRVMVVLDSNHTHNHVAAELEMYSALVTPGCYLVVMDTVIEDMPEGSFPDRAWDRGNNPKTAVRAFLAQTDRFEVDREIEGKLLLSVAPEGYLRRITE